MKEHITLIFNEASFLHGTRQGRRREAAILKGDSCVLKVNERNISLERTIGKRNGSSEEGIAKAKKKTKINGRREASNADRAWSYAAFLAGV